MQIFVYFPPYQAKNEHQLLEIWSILKTWQKNGNLGSWLDSVGDTRSVRYLSFYHTAIYHIILPCRFDKVLSKTSSTFCHHSNTESSSRPLLFIPCNQQSTSVLSLIRKKKKRGSSFHKSFFHSVYKMPATILSPFSRIFPAHAVSRNQYATLFPLWLGQHCYTFPLAWSLYRFEYVLAQICRSVAGKKKLLKRGKTKRK